jgi:hypothetical protein
MAGDCQAAAAAVGRGTASDRRQDVNKDKGTLSLVACTFPSVFVETGN